MQRDAETELDEPTAVEDEPGLASDAPAGKPTRTGRKRGEPRGDARPSKPKQDADEDDDETEGDGQGYLAKAKGVVFAHPLATLAIVVLLVLAIAGGIAWWLYARQYESTDDAFIDARSVPVSAQISGAVTGLPVTDNQRVHQGDVLLEIDPRDYQANLAQAKAQVAEDEANLKSLAAKIAAQHAEVTEASRNVAQAKSALDLAKKENARAQKLLETGAGTRERADQTASELKQNQANFAAAEAAREAAERQVTVLQAQQHVAEAQLASARAQADIAATNLSRTVIRAPVTGFATEISAAVGAYAQPGQTLMMFVPEQVWVTANFKETQLAGMKVGQPVDIEIDAYPDRSFKGHVASIQAGSGAAFSLLPPENATGNYVKVVQRVPVKIVFDTPPKVHLGPGMSVVPSVKVE